MCPTLDQRGYGRNGTCDKGAAEFGGIAPANIVTKTYYFAGAQLIAMREITSTGNALYYLHQDHLGSTSLTTNSSGAVVSRQNYYPYGEVRTSTGTTPTTIGYTGQRRDTGVGSLMFYNARYYSPYLNRWLQPDVIVPDGDTASIIPLTVSYHELPLLAQLNAENAYTLQHGHWPQLSAAEKREAKINRGPLNPQALNRYSYVMGNPIKYDDPSGHGVTCNIDTTACVGTVVTNGSDFIIYVRGERVDMDTGEVEQVTVMLGPGHSSDEYGLLEVDEIILPGRGGQWVDGALSKHYSGSESVTVTNDTISKAFDGWFWERWGAITYKTWLDEAGLKYGADNSLVIPRQRASLWDAFWGGFHEYEAGDLIPGVP